MKNNGNQPIDVSSIVTSRVSEAVTSTFQTDVYWTQSNVPLQGTSLPFAPTIPAAVTLGIILERFEINSIIFSTQVYAIE